MSSNILQYIIENNLQEELFRGNFGLEKENVRVTEDGRLALTPHPEIFGSKLENPYIKTDFSQSQLELITPVCNTMEEVYNFLATLENIVSIELSESGEYLWPQSNPPILPKEELIPIATYENNELGKEEEAYREKLAEKYGKKKQLICGIHYNFSFEDDFLRILYDKFGENKTFREFKDDIYLGIARNFLKYKDLLVELTGASPVFHNTYMKCCVEQSDILKDEARYFPGIKSLRNSHCGYRNKEDFVVSYDTLDKYINDINILVKEGLLESPKEYYSPVRLKAFGDKDMLKALKKNGISYLEFRILDLNPIYENGIGIDTLYLMHAFILYMFLKGEDTLDINSEEDKIRVIEDVKDIVRTLDIKKDYINSIMNDYKSKIENKENTYASRIISEIKKSSYIDYHISKAKYYLENSKKKRFNFIGYEDMELSTQILILDAIKRGVKVEILDRKDNFIKLTYNNKTELVKQATKTSLDNYSTVLAMENKVVTKKILEESQIRVPKGNHYYSKLVAEKSFIYYKNKSIVIKPNSTNFGLGITIFKDKYSEEDFRKAIEIAFNEDSSILIEEFIKGKEYRFLVMNNEVVGILRRVPANVEGNGVSTIRELVEEKNQDPLRGKGYKTPLEKIKLGEIEHMFLKNQGLDFTYVPKKNEIVYLRENSNISTGGDSIDYTDDIHKSYFKIAIESAKAIGAVICGVDMMIEDITMPASKDNYGIIELNFNPAIHIHCYPYKGKNRNAGNKILDLLFK